jgi:hypothetical protein
MPTRSFHFSPHPGIGLELVVAIHEFESGRLGRMYHCRAEEHIQASSAMFLFDRTQHQIKLF